MKILMFLSMLCFGANASIIPVELYGLPESKGELWTLTDSSGSYDDAGFEMEFSYGSFNSSDHVFGLYLYDWATDSIASKLAIFNSSNVVGDRTNVIWNLSDEMAYSSNGSMDLSLASDLAFGFYFISDGQTFYSQSDFNAGGKDNVGFYWDDNPFSTTNLYIYAGDNGLNKNFDSVIVSVDDVEPFKVPEPGSIALMGLALLGFGVMRKASQVNV